MKDQILQGVCCSLSAAVAFCFGNSPNAAFKFMIALMIIDYATGVLAAVYRHDLNSKIGYKGICKKVMILMLVVVGHLSDEFMLGKGNYTMTAICIWFASNEGLSILENAKKVLGEKKMPKMLISLFQKLGKESENKENKEETKNENTRN